MTVALRMQMESKSGFMCSRATEKYLLMQSSIIAMFDNLLRGLVFLIQRNLQLRMEEQRRHLQMIFEKQCKSGMNMLKGTSSATENSLKEFMDSVGNALSKSDSGVLVNSRETGRKSSNVPARENSRDVGEKHKAHESEVVGNCEANVAGASNLSPSKHAKVQG
ncbi:unnamed protein product [Fraxinus pennsylvanica]|uniref:MYB-CC type transcription factor LHEQLE-containing domain-containing protein n=1 Tax=Fraxinus pennsylvanica TaxID=56036 RepID=A0AAD1ZVW9_9LAMI|nr:unnamed protein product [Fraxinus pennsylvanica]